MLLNGRKKRERIGEVCVSRRRGRIFGNRDIFRKRRGMIIMRETTGGRALPIQGRLWYLPWILRGDLIRKTPVKLRITPVGIEITRVAIRISPAVVRTSPVAIRQRPIVARTCPVAIRIPPVAIRISLVAIRKRPIVVIGRVPVAVRMFLAPRRS
jgi:hypothetical protein